MTNLTLDEEIALMAGNPNVIPYDAPEATALYRALEYHVRAGTGHRVAASDVDEVWCKIDQAKGVFMPHDPELLCKVADYCNSLRPTPFVPGKTRTVRKRNEKTGRLAPFVRLYGKTETFDKAIEAYLYFLLAVINENSEILTKLEKMPKWMSTNHKDIKIGRIVNIRGLAWRINTNLSNDSKRSRIEKLRKLAGLSSREISFRI